MRKTLLTIVGVLGLTAGSWGQAPSTFQLTGSGDFNNTYTLAATNENGGVTVGHYWAGPIAGTYYGGSTPQQYYISIAFPVNGSPYLMSVSEFEVKEDPSQFTGTIREIGWSADGTENRAWGGLTSSYFGGYSVSYDGGGFGPGYASGSGGSVPESLLSGLTYENGQWAPAQ